MNDRELSATLYASEEHPDACPLVTVIVPSFNQAHFLGKCLSSLVNQTYSKWEAIVVDDASTMGNVEGVISSMRDRRIRLVRHSTNKGLAAARNTGFKAASSDFILPLDSDDYLESTFLEVTTKAITERPALDCVFTDFQLFGESNDVWYNAVREPKDMLEHQWIAGAGVLMRKRLWSATGGYPEIETLRHGNEDWDFWISAAERGFTAAHVPEPLYRYRRYPESMTFSTLYANDYVTRNAIYARHREFFDRTGRGEAFRMAGYLHSANVALDHGQRLYAIRLALGAVRVSPTCWASQRLIVRALCPDPLLATYRWLCRRMLRSQTAS